MYTRVYIYENIYNKQTHTRTHTHVHTQQTDTYAHKGTQPGYDLFKSPWLLHDPMSKSTAINLMNTRKILAPRTSQTPAELSLCLCLSLTHTCTRK